MTIHLVTFTDDRMTVSAEKLKESAYKFGANYVNTYMPTDLPQFFKQLAEEMFKVSKGFGLYCWKPWVVYDLMRHVPDGDFIVYADAGQTIVDDIRKVVNYMDQDVFLFSNGWNTLDWTKADVANLILGWEFPISKEDPRRKIPQTQASLIFFKVSPESRAFVKKWMLFCLMPGVCDDSASNIPNVETFAETRWDQSVLSMLQLKYGYRLHWFPTLTAYHIQKEYPNDNYPAIVDHHRKRNPGATGGTDSEW